MIRDGFRLVFAFALAAMLFLALTPMPIAGAIQAGPVRHMLAFAVLPVLSRIGWPGVPGSAQFLGYALLGGAIELVQGWMAVGRAAEFDDWFIDMAVAGVVLGVLALAGRIRPVQLGGN